jgi:hypothetical protein
MEGIPMIKCNFNGKGNIAAPAIDTENDKITTIGTALIFDILQVFLNSITNNTLSAEHITKPVVKKNCDFVPISPNSLTILVK